MKVFQQSKFERLANGKRISDLPYDHAKSDASDIFLFGRRNITRLPISECVQVSDDIDQYEKLSL